MKIMRTTGELMNAKVFALPANALVSVAQIEMVTSRIRHIPVVDDEQRVVGIVSDRDLIRLVPDGTMVLSDVMSSPVRTVSSLSPAHEAVGLMIENGFNAVPVVDADGKLVGIVTTTDFLKVARNALQGIGV